MQHIDVTLTFESPQTKSVLRRLIVRSPLSEKVEHPKKKRREKYVNEIIISLNDILEILRLKVSHLQSLPNIPPEKENTCSY